MFLGLGLDDLMEYTEWQRRKWHEWLRPHGNQALAIGAGPHGDGRFESVGDLIKHIFSAEKRYIDRLSNRPLTDPATIPNNDIEGLFEFGRRSRGDLKEFTATFPAAEWDTSMEFVIMGYLVRVTPKKIVFHIVMHEIRHWAQIATLFRLNGLEGEFHDFLGSPVMGGEWKRQTK